MPRLVSVDDSFNLPAAVNVVDDNLPARLGAGELNATYAPRWKANTAYVAGDKVISPDGLTVRAKADFTSGSLFDATKWEYGTITGSANIPVVKDTTDTRPGVWEYTHNSTTGYLFHLLAGANFGGSAAILAIGNDNGTGTSILLPNKAGGKAIVIDQRSTVTSATAYGLHATQSSTAAPLIRLEQNVDGAAPALQLLAFGTPTASQHLLYVGDPSGEAWKLYAADGKLRGRRNLEIQDKDGTTVSQLKLFSENGTADASKQYTMLDKLGMTHWNPTGTAGQWYPFRIRAGGSGTYIQTAAATATPESATYSSIIGWKHNQLGFFGVTPVNRPAAITAPTGGTTVDTEARAAITSLLTAVKNLGLTS